MLNNESQQAWIMVENNDVNLDRNSKYVNR